MTPFIGSEATDPFSRFVPRLKDQTCSMLERITVSGAGGFQSECGGLAAVGMAISILFNSAFKKSAHFVSWPSLKRIMYGFRGPEDEAVMTCSMNSAAVSMSPSFISHFPRIIAAASFG